MDVVKRILFGRLVHVDHCIVAGRASFVGSLWIQKVVFLIQRVAALAFRLKEYRVQKLEYSLIPRFHFHAEAVQMD